LLAASRHTAALSRHARPPLGRITSFPAPSYCLDRVGGDHWLAIGDAASAYDPITSHGICKALANGWLAAQVISGQSSQEGYTGSVQAAYRRYLAQRRHLYGLEQRWPDSPFWKRRHSDSNNPPEVGR
jgi:flavin-dependent dehydrogenase